MIAVDTNVVVRLLAADDPGQARKAQECVAAGAFVSHGVLMETEWVLRTVYRFDAEKVADGMLDLLDLDCIHADDDDLLRWAIERHRQGADWADLLHLIAARAQAGFVTFDRALTRQAGNETPVAIEVLR